MTPSRPKKTKILKPLRRFDFSLIQQPLDGVLLNVDRDLQKRLREAEQHQNKVEALEYLTMVAAARFAANSYHAVRYLVADTPSDSKRKPNYVLVVPTINRQLLDLLFSLVYMFDDFHARLLQFQRAGWREGLEEYQRYRQQFASDSEWKDYFNGRKQGLSNLASMCGIDEALAKCPSKVPHWGTPSKLINARTKSKPFLRWLYKWLYQDTSEQAHLSCSGLAMVYPFVMAEVVGGQDQELTESRFIEQYRYLQTSRTAFTALAIMTELNSFFHLGNDGQISYVWRIIAEHCPEGKELLEHRYQPLQTQTP